MEDLIEEAPESAAAREDPLTAVGAFVGYISQGSVLDRATLSVLRSGY